MAKLIDAEVIDLVNEGATVVEMAGILGVTPPAINYRLGKLGLKAAKAASTPSAAPDRVKIAGQPSTTEIMSATGLQRRLDARQSMSKIAADLGVPREAVVDRVKSLGLKRRPDEYAKPSARRRPVERECITCNTPFLSEGPGNRMCTACRHETEITVYSLGASKK